LTELVVRAFGPVQVVGEEFAELTDVVDLAVFGSWAARYLGEPGPDPADIDVVVVVEDAAVDRDLIYAAADRAGGRLGRPVNPTVVTVARWARRGRGEDPFLDEVAARPIVAVPVIARVARDQMGAGFRGDRGSAREASPRTRHRGPGRRVRVVEEGDSTVGDGCRDRRR
jgi:hypothetical protein